MILQITGEIMGKITAPLHGNVSEDFIEMIADMQYKGEQGNIPLRKKDGSVDIDLCLYILGFGWDYENDVAKYELLSEDVKYHRRYDSDSVYVRNAKRPYEVRKMKVYSGYIRPNYPYKSLYKDGDILTGDFVFGGELKNILDIGDLKEYEKSNYYAVEHRRMREIDNGVEE